MAKSYNQYCPMSYSLDVIGDRWTMLIVRNLMFGALRYSDLKKGLPGIASNLFASRLKEMQEADIIEQQTLPPPANVEVYALTQRGRGLWKVIKALTEWGLPYLQPLPPDNDYVGLIPFRGYLKTFFRADVAEDTQLICNLSYNNQSMSILIADGQLRTSNQLSDTPDLSLTVHDLRQFVGLLNQVVTLDDALQSDVVSLSDDSQMAVFQQFLGMFDAVPSRA